MDEPKVSAVVVTFARQPLLARCVEAILDSEGVDCDVVVIDNGHEGDELAALEQFPKVKVIRPGRNLGFAGGCNEGIRHSSGEFVALINPDAVVAPTALKRLVKPLEATESIITGAVLVMFNEPDVINSAGNEIHPFGVSWCGYYLRPLSEMSTNRDVLLLSGAAMACRRTYWDELGGFRSEFFAYYEDTEFCLRSLLRGGKVKLIDDAIVLHDYQFNRNASKMYLLDRNRMLLILALYRKRTLAILLPVILLHEVAITIFSLFNGWLIERCRAVVFILRHPSAIRSVREGLQRGRVMSDSELIKRMQMELTPENMEMSRLSKVLQRPLQLLVQTAGAVVRFLDSLSRRN